MKSFRPAKRSQACISASKKVAEVSEYSAAYILFLAQLELGLRIALCGLLPVQLGRPNQ